MRVRNIPAYAGKTGAEKANQMTTTEHPRVCGENPGKDTITWTMEGTSPRMRGKRRLRRRRRHFERNIPAYAGKTPEQGKQ